MKCFKNTLLLFVVFVLLMGCNNGNSAPTSPSETKEVMTKKNQSTSNNDLVGTEFKVAPKGDINSSKRLFTAEDGKLISSVKIISNFPNDVKYRLLFLVDYEKFEFNIENEIEKKSYLDVSISANQQKTFNVEFKNLKKGLHDVIAILIREPNKFLTKDHYIPAEQFYVFQRFQIKYGNEEITKQIEFNEINEEKGGNPDEKQLFITKNIDFKPEDVLNIINKKDIGQDYWLHLYAQKNEKFIIIPMVGYEIYPALTNGMYYKSNHDSDISLKLNFRGSDLSKKKNQINILLVRNPYINLEEKGGGIAHPELQFLDGLNRFQVQ
ncbi:hypothetical protein COE99_29470 [Bacillus toyonensis]|uniref:hypothetical protein n=1 Tax=Bacillus toyonensis TaxID=155322 RepID=UPI000BFD4B34|nr:hypothetical protein [Bacillus toyonensis]PHB99116.1 hypothetical protein COE99_29470 [Bacillus toyonensis]